MYCEKHGFRYASKLIPDDWLEEARKGSEYESHSK
jgi:hypothetical protein